MNKEIREHLNKVIKRELGISYEEFESLDFDEQQRLIKQNRQKKRKQNKNDDIRVMIGSGEDSVFVTKKRGERYMLSDGTYVIAGDTPEESRARLEDRMDDAIYSKPVAFVKKLSRKIKNI